MIMPQIEQLQHFIPLNTAHLFNWITFQMQFSEIGVAIEVLDTDDIVVGQDQAS